MIVFPVNVFTNLFQKHKKTKYKIHSLLINSFNKLYKQNKHKNKKNNLKHNHTFINQLQTHTIQSLLLSTSNVALPFNVCTNLSPQNTHKNKTEKKWFDNAYHIDKQAQKKYK